MAAPEKNLVVQFRQVYSTVSTLAHDIGCTFANLNLPDNDTGTAKISGYN